MHRPTPPRTGACAFVDAWATALRTGVTTAVRPPQTVGERDALLALSTMGTEGVILARTLALGCPPANPRVAARLSTQFDRIFAGDFDPVACTAALRTLEAVVQRENDPLILGALAFLAWVSDDHPAAGTWATLATRDARTKADLGLPHLVLTAVHLGARPIAHTEQEAP